MDPVKGEKVEGEQEKRGEPRSRSSYFSKFFNWGNQSVDDEKQLNQPDTKLVEVNTSDLKPTIT